MLGTTMSRRLSQHSQSHNGCPSGTPAPQKGPRPARPPARPCPIAALVRTAPRPGGGGRAPAAYGIRDGAAGCTGHVPGASWRSGADSCGRVRIVRPVPGVAVGSDGAPRRERGLPAHLLETLGYALGLFEAFVAQHPIRSRPSRQHLLSSAGRRSGRARSRSPIDVRPATPGAPITRNLTPAPQALDGPCQGRQQWSARPLLLLALMPMVLFRVGIHLG